MQETEVVRPFEEIRNMYLDEIDIYLLRKECRLTNRSAQNAILFPLFPNYLSMIMVIT